MSGASGRCGRTGFAIVPRYYPQLNYEGLYICTSRRPFAGILYSRFARTTLLCLGTCHNPRWLGHAGFSRHSSDAIP